MKHFLLPLALFFSVQFSCLAQLHKLKPDDIAGIKARQLIIVLREAEPEKIEKYKKEPRKLTAYKKEVAAYNERIQKVAPRFWKFNGTVLFMPASEVTALQKSRSKEYALAEFHLQKVKEKPTLSPITDPFREDQEMPTLTIRLIEKPSASLGDYQFMDRTPTEAELAIGLLHLQAAYTNLEKGVTPQELQQQHTEALKTKILVLDQAQFKAWIADPEMKNLYPYPYEKADKATIDRLIIEQNPKYAILSIAPMVDEPKLKHSVIDLATGDTLSSVVPGAAGTGINYRDATVITKESIMGYANGVGQ